jgi:hypothetical protein
MDEFFNNVDQSRKQTQLNEQISELYMKYTIIGIILVMLFIFCKNFKIDNTKRVRGKVVSFV